MIEPRGLNTVLIVDGSPFRMALAARLRSAGVIARSPRSRRGSAPAALRSGAEGAMYAAAGRVVSGREPPTV